MVRLVEKNGYDGIDMDWEITLDKELHARMMALLRERFDELSERTGRYYYLTTALSIDTSTIGRWPTGWPGRSTG